MSLRPRFAWFLAVGIWLLCASAWGQGRPPRNDRQTMADSLRWGRSFFRPRQLVFSLEASGLMQPLWCRCGLRATTEMWLRMRSFQLEVHLGYEKRGPWQYRNTTAQAPLRSEEQYSSEGYFFKIGPALRLDRGERLWMASLGLHYAEAGYREQFAVSVNTPLQDEPLWQMRNNWRRLRWGEISLAMKISLWKGLQLGYRLHFAFGAKQRGGDNRSVSFYAPEYGRLDKLGKFGLRYYMSYRFSLKRRPPRGDQR